MIRKTLGKSAGALTLAFAMAAGGIIATPAAAARNTEPYSCQINGRVYDPQPASIVINAETGDIIGGENIDELRYPASMTKIMTALLIFDALRDGRISLNDQIRVYNSADVQQTYGNSRSSWLQNGEVITVEEAILAITVGSANNVSVMMAEHIAGSQANFVRMMNDRAAALGMESTVFTNPHGLPDRSQVTTARDMAVLAVYIQDQYPEYYHYFSADRAEFGSRIKYNYNELVTRNNYIDGIKTGFICDSGYNIAVSAERGGAEVITIVFGGRTPHQRNVLAQTLTDDALEEIIRQQSTSAPDLANIYDDVAETELVVVDAQSQISPQP